MSTIGRTENDTGWINVTDDLHDVVATRRSELQQTMSTFGDPTPQSLIAREALVLRLLLDGNFGEAFDECSVLCQGWSEVDAESAMALESRRLLVWALRESGRSTEAVDEQRQIVSGSTRINGPHSAETLGSRHNLVVLLQRDGRDAAARAECADLVTSCLRELGPDHVVTRGVAARQADLETSG